MDDIKRKQLILYGHVQRMKENRLPKQIMEWVSVEKRRRGRSKTTWEMGMRRAINENDWTKE